MQNLPKHEKYKVSYKPNEVFWGLGVEHETYLETSKMKQITVKELKEKRARERYCVDYYNVYNKDQLEQAMDGLFEPETPFLIPILVNSHTFQRTDLEGEHATTYERVPKPNPKFGGKTLFEWIQQQNSFFSKEYEKSYLFDGDTLEFMTQDFYNATVKKVVEELCAIETLFIHQLNALPREGILKTYGPFQLAQENYPFATYLTNLKNNAMFNNGTIHINITLPSELDETAHIKDPIKFKEQHQILARAIQWLSPLMVAKYGAHDPLCESKTNGQLFSAGSQRVAVSRYIGLGTYNTDKMPTGKILTAPKKELENIEWYDSFHKNVDYKYLDELGLDINFNKHYAHGIEFRILESIPYGQLEDVLKTIVYLADFSLENDVPNPTKNKIWHTIAENCVHNGKGYHMDVQEQNELFRIFQISQFPKEPIRADEVYDIIAQHLTKYRDNICSKCMIKGEKYPQKKEVSNVMVVDEYFPQVHLPFPITLTDKKQEVQEEQQQEQQQEQQVQQKEEVKPTELLTHAELLTQVEVVEVKKKGFLCC
jgi:hypothetical protein